jgi:hypothetical protein
MTAKISGSKRKICVALPLLLAGPEHLSVARIVFGEKSIDGFHK